MYLGAEENMLKKKSCTHYTTICGRKCTEICVFLLVPKLYISVMSGT